MKEYEDELFWVVTPCRVMVGCQRFLTLKLGAARTSETLVLYHITYMVSQTTRPRLGTSPPWRP